MRNRLYIFILQLFVVSTLFSQTCSSLSGIINTYAPVSAISGNVVTIGATSGATAPFTIGDYVILIQMTGPPPPQTGSNMGKYELRTVTAVSGSSITLDGIINTYTTSEKVQLVRAPYCPTATVSALVTAKAWDGTTGGIIALKGNTLTLNADIIADGLGYSLLNPPTSDDTPSLSSGQGSIDGRGFPATITGSTPTYKPLGGGGIGGGGGTGDPSHPSYVIGGGLGGQKTYTTSTPGGGGGIIGGGGGGAGNGTIAGVTGLARAGGGGGVAGGGAASSSEGYGGDGVMLVSNGKSTTGIDSYGASGGGSYGGGGGAPSAWSGGDDGLGGGGGGSWTGGGIGGKSGTSYSLQLHIPGDGNDPASIVIPDDKHYLNTVQPRIMMGGAGGNSYCQTGGLGGGIIILDFDDANGNNHIITSNGVALGKAPYCFSTFSGAGAGGAGGGAGGQIILNIKSFLSKTNITANGGKGGDGEKNSSQSTFHGGTGGAGGGGGGIWVYGSTKNSNTGGQIISVTNTNLTGTSATLAGVAGAPSGSNIVNPKNGYLTATGGAGGNGLIIQSPDIPSWSATCSLSLTATPGTCNPTNNQYSVTGDITFSNAPSTGTLTVTIGAVNYVFSPPFTSPQSYTLNGLISDGASHTATAVFSADANCTNTANYTAPISCSTGCLPDTIRKCTNSPVQLVAADGMTNYQWYEINNTDTTAVSGETNQTFVTTIAGKYIVKAGDANGCPIQLCCPIVVADSICTSCSSSVTAVPGTCNPANNQYTLTGQITLTNPPSTGTVTVEIVGGGSQTFLLPLTSPISYSIAGQIADGSTHTVDVTISGVSCASTISYTAPVSCIVNCPTPNCVTLKSKKVINN